MLQQFDFNVDKAVQAFVDGKYTSPELKMLELSILCIFVCFSLNALEYQFITNTFS